MNEHNDQMAHNRANEQPQNETVHNTTGTSAESRTAGQTTYDMVTSVHATGGGPSSEAHDDSVSSTAPTQTNGLSVAGLVCGIIGVIMSLIPFVNFFLGSILGILAVVFGAISKKRDGSGMPGLVLGVVTLVIILLWAIVLLVFLVFVSEMDSSMF